MTENFDDEKMINDSNHFDVPAPISLRARRIQRIKKILTIGLFTAIPVLLFMLVKNLEWHEVAASLKAYQLGTISLGLAIALISYLVFSSYDLVGRSYTRHSLTSRQVLPVAFVCYAFNINLSSWIGGVALRYRLYSRLGLSIATITRIISLSVLTNTLGYIIVAGIIFSMRLVKLPENWELSVTALQGIGVLLLMVAAFYLWACGFSKRRSWWVFNHEIALPSLPLALAQVFLATLNWSLMAFLIFLLLPPSASYSSVLGLLLISGMAGMLVQVPAGIGVLEAVFLTLLQHQFSKASIFAALLAYRAIYFLIPLAIACLIYVILEGKAKKQSGRHSNLTESPDEPNKLATLIIG
jgi:uncharacterized membrane protein YbhN (UPF0104 family)